jgi:hypothetical protein
MIKVLASSNIPDASFAGEYGTKLDEGRKIYRSNADVAGRFLNVSVRSRILCMMRIYAGVRRREPVVQAFPKAKSRELCRPSAVV